MGTIKKTQCSMCAASCGLEMEVENNQIISVRPDPDSPRSDNYCCRKGRAASYHTHHKERLTHPLKRVGDRFIPISWEQANKEIAEKANAILAKHGPRSFGLLGGALTGSHSPLVPLYGLMDGIGAQYHFNPVGIEFMGSWWSNGRIYGDQIRFQEPDDHNVDALVLWGCNAYVTHQMASARKVIRKHSQDPNKKVIVVDPVLSESARMADMHIALRAGTDALFAKALIAIIFEQGWHDQAFMDKWCNDVERIMPWFKGFDIEKALAVCRVPYAQALSFARILSDENWGVHQDLGVFCGRHNTLNSYLIVMLTVITGSMLVPKNNIVHDLYMESKTSNELDPNIWRTKDNCFPVAGVYPAGSFAQQVLNDDDDRIRMVFSSMNNPARSYPDSHRVKQALESLELLVCDDICMTETTQHAHYILPAKSTYEGQDFNTFQMNFPHVVCQLRQPVVEAPGECKETAEIWLDIADAMGLIPTLPAKLYSKAKHAVAHNDRIPYALELVKFLAMNKQYENIAQLIVGKTLGKPMGSAAASMLYAAMLISPLASSGKIERAGIKPNKKHFILNRLPKLKELTLMDAVFQHVMDKPEGVIIATTDIEDTDEYIRQSIKHEDKQFHLYCDEIDQYIKQVTPEQEQQQLDHYPFILSSGRHTDFGVNTTMRNPDSYQHREGGYSALINPTDAKMLNISEGEIIKIVTDAGEIEIPAQLSYKTTRGYAVVPHHYGLTFNGHKTGMGANQLTHEKAMDSLTGNPILRYVPCHITRLTSEQVA